MTRIAATIRMAFADVDLFRHEILFTCTPPSEGVIAEVVDGVFLPRVQG